MVKTAQRFPSLPENRLGTLVEKKRALVARGMDIIDLGAATRTCLRRRLRWRPSPPPRATRP